MVFSWKSLGASEENESLSAGKTRNPQPQHDRENLGEWPRVQQQFLGWEDLAGKIDKGCPRGIIGKELQECGAASLAGVPAAHPAPV